jgi:hypothetical protein
MKNQNLIITSLVAVTLLGAVGIYFYRSGTKPQSVEVATISSLSKASSSSSMVSSSVSSQLASSSIVTTLSSKTQIVSNSSSQEVKVSSKSESKVSQTSNQSDQDLSVVYLDSNNPPQYIKDYWTCKSDNNRLFYYENGQIKHDCPTLVCPKDKPMLLADENRNWVCRPPYDNGTGVNCSGGISILLYENSIFNKIDFDRTVSFNYDPEIYNCILFIKENLTKDDIKLLQNTLPNTKFIIYKP